MKEDIEQDTEKSGKIRPFGMPKGGKHHKKKKGIRPIYAGKENLREKV